MSVDCHNASSSYRPESFVRAFHSIPHFDLDLNEVSSNFSPSLTYFEPIIIWVCVPILVCLCVFILLSVYFICVCCCCCCREKQYRSRTCNLSCALLICVLILFCLGLIGAIFYAEVSLNNNIKSFIGNGRNAVSDIQELSNFVNGYNSSLVNTSISTVIEAISTSSGSGQDDALMAAQIIKELNEDVQTSFTSISNGVGSIQYKSTIDSVQGYETIRNWTVIGFFVAIGCLLMAICLFTICMSPVCVTIMLVILSIATILVWLITGGVLGSAVMIADICHDPDALLMNYTTDTTARELVNYIISCDSYCRPNDINEPRNAIQIYRGTEDIVSAYITTNTPLVVDYFNAVRKEFNVADSIVNNITSIVTCSSSQGLREYYISALDSFCTRGELFVVIILSLLGGLATSLFLLMCCLTCFDGLLINTSHEVEIDQDDIVAFDSDRAATWSSAGRRLSYSEPYSNGGRGREELRMSDTGQSPPKYHDIGARPGSGDYDHFDV